MEALGIPRVDGGPTETDPRRIWQLFADHFHLFRGTPSGAWLSHEFEGVFGITEPLTARVGHADLRPRSRRAWPGRSFGRARCSSGSASRCCARPMRRPTRSSGTSTSAQSGWTGVVRPTFRPDLAINLRHPSWRAEIDRLGAQTGPGHHVLRPLHPGARAAPAVLQADGRHGHRSRRRDAVHRRAVARRRRGRLSARPGGPGHDRGRSAASPATC